MRDRRSVARGSSEVGHPRHVAQSLIGDTHDWEIQPAVKLDSVKWETAEQADALIIPTACPGADGDRQPGCPRVGRRRVRPRPERRGTWADWQCLTRWDADDRTAQSRRRRRRQGREEAAARGPSLTAALIEAPDIEPTSPLTYVGMARFYGYANHDRTGDLARALIEAGADKDDETKNGSPLICAASHGDAAVARSSLPGPMSSSPTRRRKLHFGWPRPSGMPRSSTC